MTNACNHMPKYQGFTIIELIVAIVLMGIISVVVIPRFLEPSAFDEAAAQDGLITTIRAAQQAALGRSNVSFAIENSGDRWQFLARSGVGNELIRSLEVPKNSIRLETGSAAASSDTCATASGDFDTPVASDFLLTFDAKGDLASFTNDGSLESVDENFNGVRICVNDSVEFSVCVSPAGFAYAGNCDA